jgi:hypothetical protein
MDHTKYPRTWHLPFSPGATSDDKTLSSCEQFEGEDVVITVKMDGENTTGYSSGYLHARSLDSRGGEDRDWVKQFWAERAHLLPAGYRVCGENLWAQHSIHYDALPSYFLGFSIWNEQNVCLSWADTVEWFELLDVKSVEVLYQGPFSEEALRYASAACEELWQHREGYVVRLAREFKYDDFKTSVAKYVRAGHVTTDTHWRHSAIKPNGLALGSK